MLNLHTCPAPWHAQFIEWVLQA